MDNQQKERITRFLNDKATCDDVWEALMTSFLGPVQNGDTQYLAAERIAIALLQIAWKDLKKHRIDTDDAPPAKTPHV